MTEFGEIFQLFLEHHDRSKAIFVASSDENGQPDCAPKMVVDIVKPNKVYYLDFKFSQSFVNLSRNRQISLSYMDEPDFTGFKLKGYGQVLDPGPEYATVKRRWIRSGSGSEIALSDDFVIIKFSIEEAAPVKPDRELRAIKKTETRPIESIAKLQTRVAELERSEAGHLETERGLSASRDLLQKTIDGVTTPVMVIGRDYKIVLANRALNRLAGDQDCAAKGLACHQVSHHNDSPCSGPTTQCPLRQVLLFRAPVTVVHTHYDTEGKETFVEVRATPVFGADNEVVQVIESCHDITERRNLERTVLEIKEKEQQLIGQELHDGIAQQLTAAALVAKVLEKKVDEDPSRAKRDAKRVVHMVNQAISQTRELAYGLYGLEMKSVQSKNMAALLKKLAHDVENSLGIRCAVQIDENVSLSDDEVATHLYRIAREAVGNAVKHGHTKNIRIHLKKRNAHESELRIENDGKKFLGPFAQEGLGLRLMRTRAAKANASFEIKPRPLGGAAVSCIFPV